MSGPERLRLKRRLGDRPPDQLIVEETAPQKRSFTDSERHKRYYLKTTSDLEPLDNFNTPDGPVVQSGGSSDLKNGGTRRTFRLSRADVKSQANSKQRKGKDDDLVTVEERQPGQSVQRDIGDVMENGDRTALATKPLKRPGKGSAVRPLQPQQQRESIHVQDTPASVENSAENEHVQSIADDLHRFALEELAKGDKPKMTSMPHLTGARSRELHRQRATMAQTPLPAASADVDMEDDGGAYVYDTYVLVSTSSRIADEQGAAAATHLASPNVGYIVITDDDVETWEMYMEGETSDKDWDSEDEDENAERYHGADYPEDELASDDEYDRGAYGYRNQAGSDDEEYDEDTGAYSDEGEELWRRKTPAEFVKHINARQEVPQHVRYVRKDNLLAHYDDLQQTFSMNILVQYAERADSILFQVLKLLQQQDG
nr:hypothetical protein CFP56_07640 [Quercus suber]